MYKVKSIGLPLSIPIGECCKGKQPQFVVSILEGANILLWLENKLLILTLKVL